VEATKTTVIRKKIIGVPEKIGQSNACFTFGMEGRPLTGEIQG
jgi:hypothetical protein